MTELSASAEKALLCARAALSKKAENLKILDLGNLSAFADYFVICSGSSDRQVKAICDAVSVSLRENGKRTLSTEGYAEGRWVLIDLGDVIVHVFQDALREYYGLETLWASAPRLSVPTQYYLPTDSAHA